MPYCKNCGAELTENAKFCAKCGTPVVIQTVERSGTPSPKRKGISPWALAGIAMLATVVVLALVAGALFSGLFPIGRIVGSGNIRTQQEDVSDFTIVEVGSGFTVQITQASSYGVSITADDNIFSYIQVIKTGSTLAIRLAPNLGVQTTALRAEITMPNLQAVQFSGGVNGTARGFDSSNDFRAELSGGSTLVMEGHANSLRATCSGGSSLDLSDFAVNNADIDFSGGSHGTINASGTINANLSGGSRLYYIGNPTLGDVNTSGGSSISRRSEDTSSARY